MVLTEATGNGELVVLSFKNTYRRFPIEVEQRVSYHLPHIYVQSSRDRPARQFDTSFQQRMLHQKSHLGQKRLLKRGLSLTDLQLAYQKYETFFLLQQTGPALYHFNFQWRIP